jgi:hypothetical protein
MNNKVIYTCITGGYDSLLQPEQVYEGYDYICFTDDASQSWQGVWEIRPIPFSCDDKVRLSRFLKLCPHKALNEYKYSVYIDSNIQILDNFLYNCVEDKIKENVKISLPMHPENRKDIYEEAVYVMKYRRAKFHDVNEQIKYLRRDGYPECTGMYENNIIFRQHNDPTVVMIGEMWWDVFMGFTKRDQLSFVYVLWKLKVWPPYLLPEYGQVNVNTKYSSNGNLHLRRIYHQVIKREKVSFITKCSRYLWYITYEQLRIFLYRIYFQFCTRVYGYSVKA